MTKERFIEILKEEGVWDKIPGEKRGSIWNSWGELLNDKDIRKIAQLFREIIARSEINNNSGNYKEEGD